MAAPVEFRFYLRKFTLDDARQGTAPIKQQTGPPGPNGMAPWDMFAPPQLQWRYKEKVHVDGKPVLEWSPWADVLFVREGEDLQPEPPSV